MPSSGSPGNNVGARVFDQKMDVVGRHHIVEHGQIKAFLALKNPTQVTATVTLSVNSSALEVPIELLFP